MRLAPALAFALAPFAASAIIFNVNGSNADVLVGASNCKTLQLLANWDLQTQPFSSDSGFWRCETRPVAPANLPLRR